MAGRAGSEFGDEVRKLINTEIEAGGNPTWATTREKVQKIAAKLGDKRDEKKLAAAFGQIKINLKKKDGKPAKGKKRGRPAGNVVKKAGRPAKTNGHLSNNGFDLAISYARAAGGLDQAIATLNQLKAIKESL